jgi:hypothetical protein
MKRLILFTSLPILLALAPAAAAGPKPKDVKARLLELYTQEASGYAMYRDANRKEKLELQLEPVYVWTNPVRGGEQDGAVFVWTYRGRAEVVGTFFSYPASGPRNLNHELHSLSLSVLNVRREGLHSWSPEAPGIELAPLADAPTPARTPALRLAQMRALTRDFAATTEDDKAKRWELRTLPKPLYRYESTDPAVLDGAVFAYVTSAGTDPEALLVIEARRAEGTEGFTWQYATARFTDMSLTVRCKGKEVLNVPLIPWDSPQQDPKHRYRTFRDRGIPAVEDPTQ